MKKIFSLIKRFLLSFIILYGFNTISFNFNIVIPFNIITLLIITLFNFYGLFLLAFLYVIIF